MAKKTDNNHKYYVNADGEHVMRVSDVIKLIAKEQLIIWANNLGFKGISYKKELERTANIGSLCHSVIEKYFNKNYLADVDYDDYGITDENDQLEVRRALDSFFVWFEGFLKHHTYNVKFTERVVVGKNLGGTIDCGIDGWEDPKKVIFVDYKTSGDFYLTQFLQLAAYTMLYEENYGKNTVEGVMVTLLSKKKGKRARARFIPRKNLDPFILCFQCLYDSAQGVHILNKNLWELSQVIE
jgi:hypothetical protein